MVDINLSTLNGRNGFIISGLDESALLGDALSSAGDLNGDGKTDIIIGARGTDLQGKNNAGKVYVIFGNDKFETKFDLSKLDGSNGFSIEGLNARDFFGTSVSNLGDINGDNLDDIIIGANGNNRNAGASYVIFGQNNFNQTIDVSNLNGNNGFTISGLNSEDLLGFSVSGAGDVNGDDIPDFIVSATGAETNSNTDTGASYVVFGGANVGQSGSLELSALDGNNGFVINGINPDDFTGTSVSSAGDINKDGFDDLVIGAVDIGKVYVLFGRNNTFTRGVNLSDLNGTNGFVINGIEPNNGTGFSVADAGDVNGDKISDIIIGANLADIQGRENAGQAYVVFGKETGFDRILELSDLDGTNGFTINGAAIDNLLGSSVSGAGDVNGDGISDIIVGASTPGVQESPGKSYVIFGRENDNKFSAVLEVTDLKAAEGFVISSDDNTNILLGEAVSGAGDVNGDGIDDIIVGAPESDPDGNDNAGESYVIFGRVTYPGDINNDRAYTSADAYGISRLAAGLETEFSAYPGIDPVAVADVNRDGVVSAFDAYVVSSVVNGIESEFISPIPT